MMISSSSSGGAFRLRWDVFLSFRGEDTRECFTKKLYESLHREGIRAFMDDEGLDRGDNIQTSLLQAIDDSAASIVIISENYADSHWCLDELARICDSRRLVIPVFYKVDPSHARKQLGPFKKGFDDLEKRFQDQKDKVQKWRDSMLKIGGFAGFVVKNNSDDVEHENLIRRLVQRVLKELSNTPMVVSEFAVGLNKRVDKVMDLLQVRSNGVKVLGLYGMGGVGKTTLAKALFNSLVGRFERRCFVSNVRQFSSKDGLVSLQSNIIKDLSPEEGARSFIGDVNAGISVIKRIIRENRVLLVLDDVDNVNQLDALIGKREWFYEGSCIIITTRDITVLPEKHVNKLYEVTELDTEEALELFSYHALRKKEPPQNFLDFSNKIVSLTGRMPLALEVFGCFLFGKRRVEEWEDAVEKLRTIRPGSLHDVLKISYDGLDEPEKCIFLNIACFFVQMGTKRDDVIDRLRGCGFSGEIAMTNLVEKCLIKIRQHDNTLWMHDQIRDMGRQIVLDENHVDPGMRSRLWDCAEIMSVLKSKKISLNMARAFDSIKDINDRKEIWKLAVKVESLWTVKRGTDDQVEFIIRDVKGDKIHVTITPEEAKKRGADIQELMKLKTQSLHNFRVQKYDAKFKWTEHPYKLMFVSGTKVYPNNDIPDMPVCGFKFKPFDEIKALKFREDLLVDVIGAVHELGSPQTTMGGKLKFPFTIKDLSANVIDCCLWDSLAAQFVDYLNTKNDAGPIVVIIKHARLKHATDTYPLQITNTWIGTFLIINDDIPAINDFKQKLPSDNTYATQTNMIKASSIKFSQSSASGSCRTPQDKFIRGHPVIKIKDIVKLPKDKICCTVGTTSHVRVSTHGWCFPGCKDCIKQCSGDAAPFKCRDGHSTDVPIIRYKVDVQVYDGDDSAKFVFWDNTCIDLLGVTSSELKQKLIKDGVTDPDEYPQKLDEMMGRMFAFRVNWQSDWKQCSVLACLDSKPMVDTLQAELGYIQVNPVNHATLTITETEDTIDEDISASSEHDPETVSNLTPTKRSPTLPSPGKMKKRIKKEK